MPWPGPAVVLMRQPDGSVMAFPYVVHQMDFERGGPTSTRLRMDGYMAEGRVWNPEQPVPFEQAAIEGAQVGVERAGA